MQDLSSIRGLRLPYSGKRRSVDFDQIIRLEGQANYTVIWFLDGSQLLVALTLKRLLLRLPAGSFIRPHRKHLVNRLFVVSVSSVNHVLHLASGETIAISRRKFSEVRRQVRGGVSASRLIC